MTLICILLLALSAAPMLGLGPEEAEQRLLDATGGLAKVRMNKATGVAKFVRLPGGLKALSGSPEARAAAFLAEYGGLFGIKDAARELESLGVARSPAMTHVSFQQFHRGVPVFGGLLRASFDRNDNLVAVNGVFLPDLKLDTTPRWSAEAAAEIAVRHVGEDKVAGKGLKALNTTLFVFRAGLVQGVSGPNHLVWEVEVVNPRRTVREFVYVDAHFGKIVDQITGIHEAHAFHREIYEGSLSNLVWIEGDPDPIPAGWAGGSAQQVMDWQNEIDGARETYNIFGSMTGGNYLSYDGANAHMLTVNNDPNINCPNANWNGTSTNYCSDVTGDDTVAHEWGHAYTEYTNNLIYQWQSGALNEAYSDMWGEVVDFENGRGTDSPGGARSAGGCSIYGSGNPSVDNSYRWLSGEDDPAFNGAIRDLWNPNCYGDPGKVTDTGQYICSTSDAGGVHTNSGIPNHGFALMVDGGTYNGVTVGGIGLTKAARIHWEAQNLLTPASDFVDHADALDAACAALIGATLYELDAQSPNGVVSGQSVTAGDCTEVADASAAVEFRTEPTFCGFTTLLDPNAPALCGGGTVNTLHLQDFESGLGGWTVGTRAVVNPATFDNPDWAVVSPLPDRSGSAAFVEDSPNIGDCDTDIEAGVLYLESPVISIPAGAVDPALAFDHWVATEADWDGGNVKISTNGGSFSLVRGNKFSFNSYNSSIVRSSQGFPNDNPLAGEAAFTGTDGGSNSGTWGQSQINLSAGDDVQIRFEMGLDGCFGIIGWYVDDVHVHECGGGGGGFCGDNMIDPGETCDGTDLGGETCISQGCTGGTLACESDCSAFDTSGCTGCACFDPGEGQPCTSTTVCCSGVGNCTGGKPSNRVCQ
jgi:Zn-dependent metalloprotease